MPPRRTRRPSRRRHPGFPRLIGVIHLPPLVGAPSVLGDSPVDVMKRAGERAVKEAKALEKAGFEALILENFGDVPFYGDQVPPETIASLSILAAAVNAAVRIPIGINVLRNDARAALAIAAVSGSEFIRVNVLAGVAATDQGIMQGQSATLVRERGRLLAPVRIFADAHVKHAQTLSSQDIAIAIEEIAGRGGADAVIITGETTGRPVDLQQLEKAALAAEHCGVPLYIGSGATPENAQNLLRLAHGLIVGSALREHGRAGEKLDPKRIRTFVKAARQ